MKHIFSHRRKQELIYLAVTLITLVITSVLYLLRLPFKAEAFTIGPLTVRNDLPLFYIQLLVTLCGELPAIFIFLAVFCFLTVKYGAISSFLFLGELIAAVTFIPVKYRWYKSKALTALFVPLSALIISIASNILVLVLREQTISIQNICSEFLTLIPSALLTACCGYVIFNYAPPKIRQLFPAFVHFDASTEGTAAIFIGGKHSPISFKIMRILFIEALVLIVGAAMFSAFLFIETNYAVQQASIVDIFIAKATMLFNAKLILMLITFAYPVLHIANLYAQIYIASPIRLMSKAMNDFASDTTKEEQNSVLDIHLLHIKTKDEIGELFQSLKKTTSKLTSYISWIQEEQRLKEDLRVAQESNKAKTAFLSNMSHEIRTPINAVLGLDEMILRESSEKEIIAYAADIKSAGRSLLSLINDILDFSKIEAGKMEIIPVEYELSSSINDLVNMISQRAADKGLALKINVDEKTPHKLFGDELRIKQCILNILTNAVKYTREGTVTMNIGWEKAEDGYIMLRVQVLDTGIGIKKEDLPKLFHAFERIEEKRNHTIEGTGLGMNIVQQLLALMDSHLEVKSVYGEGSDFSFAVKQKVVSWEAMGNFMEMYEKFVKANSEYHESFHAPDAHILVVDDTKLNLTVVQGLLKQTQIQIDTAESGQKALQLVAEKKYDLIFLDHRMPGLDGIETLHVMQTMDANQSKKAPVIALTANAISGAREMYLNEGFTDYLTKPIESGKLEKLLISYLPPERITKVQKSDEKAAGPVMPSFTVPKGIDAAAALKNCGSEEVFKEALKDFYEAINSKASAIEAYEKQGDFKNYTILVHALKSSARLIGADALSQEAAYLEGCGDRQDAKAIAARTPALLSHYRAYWTSLAPLFGGGEEPAKQLLSEDDYARSLANLKDCITAFDFDMADSIIAMLDEHAVPPKESERFRQIKEKVRAVDREAALALLG
mgnify:CR=1 FL=1